MLRTDIDWLICTVLLPGTPIAFATYDEFCQFRAMVAEELSVHPSSIIFRGTTKIGFSLTPRPEKAWMEVGADSDVDLAVVDPDHFHFLDEKCAGGNAIRQISTTGRTGGMRKAP